MSDSIVFCDVETVHLRPTSDCIWEVGLLVDDAEYHWFLPANVGDADARALAVGGFYQRFPRGRFNPVNGAKIEFPTGPLEFSDDFARLTAGKTLGGANPAFDAERLALTLRANDACPAWSHRLLDVEAYVAGALGWDVPMSLTECCMALDVDLGDDKHTALGDARLAKAVYEAALKVKR